MILAETALSFLGLGLRAPVVSWGVLLNDAQDVRIIANQPWILLPAISVIVFVISFNFVGDGSARRRRSVPVGAAFHERLAGQSAGVAAAGPGQLL